MSIPHDRERASIVDRLNAERMFGKLRVAEVQLGGACHDDQAVTLQLCGASVAIDPPSN